MKTTDWLISERQRLVIVKDPGNLAELIRNRYPNFDVAVTPSYLSGVAALSGGSAQALLVGVDPAARKLPEALAGLRKAAGSGSRLVLCCQPSGEPAARAALAAGADDYLIYPPVGAELDEALGVATAKRTEPIADLPVPTWTELEGIASILSTLDRGRRPTLERLCRLVAETLRTAHVRIIAGDMAVHVGDPKVEPAVVEKITSGGRTLGEILVGARQRSPFLTSELEKLRHYGRLIAHLLDAAEQQHHWQSLALIDEATGLPNRRYLIQALESIIARAAAERFRVTVLFFDLDGFKHFNDEYGHATGDQILRETGQLFRRHSRQHDIVARYAGDEFVVVFWDAEEPRIAGSRHPTDALAVLRRFKKALEGHEFPTLGPEATGRITISAGLATFPWDASDAAGLIDRADQAMLQAKRAGKNRIYLVGGDAEAATTDLDSE